MCGEVHSHKNCPNKDKETLKCANCREPHVANYRGCPAYKDRALRQHAVHNQISYASSVKQASPSPPTTHLKCKWHDNFYCPTWKSLKSQERCRLPFLNIFSRSKVIKIWRLKKWSKKLYRGLGKYQSKLIKSVTSCDGHLAWVDLSMYCSSANTCQNQVKLCTLKV